MRARALVPVSTKPPSPSGLAVVLAAPASEPLPGSESPKTPSFSPLAYGVSQRSFCSGVAHFSTGAQ